MAKVLKTDLPGDRQGRSDKYNWDEWLDGRPWELTRGTDFHVSPANFRSAAYNAASRLDTRVRVHVVSDSVVQLQAYPAPSA